MFKPQYKIILKRVSFPSDQAICLGSQLIVLTNFIKRFLPSHTWYGANIDGRGPAAPLINQTDFRLRRIGIDSDLIRYCEGIDQFIWGVFLCVDNRFENQNFQDLEVGTEDPPFRDIELKGILLEIRAFDTSFFEIYSQDALLIENIAKNFKTVDIINRK